MTIGRMGGDKVGLIGTGMVGSSFAFALMQSGLADELVLIDADATRAAGEAMDLNHGLPFVGAMRIRAGGYEDLAGAELVVITAGRNQKPGESRLDLLQKNAAVMEDIAPKLDAAAPEAVVVVATNPVDILTQIVADRSGRPRGLVLGSGTVLDSARFRYLLGDHLGVNPRSVHASIVGEHGDTQVPVWSQARIGGLTFDQFCRTGDRRCGPEDRDRIAEATRTAAYEIIRGKGATYYAIGLGLLAIIEAVLRDQKTVLTVSCPLTGQYGAPTGIAASLPSIVGRDGVERVLDPPLDELEADAFRRSARSLAENLDRARRS